MNAKVILGLFFVVSLLALGVVAFRTPDQAATAATAPPEPIVLVAAKPVPVGTLLRAEDVRWQSWKDAIGPTFLVKATGKDQTAGKAETDEALATDVFGAVARQRIEEGRPLVTDDIVKPGDRGFLAAVLRPGYRAISVAVTAVSGGAGLIFPGDRVDLLLTQTFGNNTAPERRSVSETVATDLRVLAIDQHVQQSQTAPASDGAVARTVTLEVQPEMAEKISVATELGKLSLILRSLDSGVGTQTAAADAKEATRPTWAVDVSPALKRTESIQVAEPPPVKILHGSREGDGK